MTLNSTPPDHLDSNKIKESGFIRLFILLALIIGSYIWYTNPQLMEILTSVHPQKNIKPNIKLNITPVVVATARQKSVDIDLFGLGAITPLNTVKVHSRVNGQLMKIAFKEGQMVKKGDFLAQIDSRPFETQITHASGQLQRDKALLDNAKVDLKRYRTLLKQDSISKQLVDTQQSLVHQYEGAIRADQEVINTAKLQIGYTRIVAPISGRVGFSQINPGNIIRTSDTTSIVIISQVNPISVVFPIPEDTLPRVLDLIATGKKIPVTIYDRALKNEIGQGHLIATDNQIDATTGTIKLKAKLSNPDGRLFANQFVNVKMPIATLSNAIVIPTEAIQRGVPGTFVYLAKEDNLVVKVTPVIIGPSQDGITVIKKGVAIGDKVVIEGADRLRENAKIKIISTNTHAEDMHKQTQEKNNKDNTSQI